MCSSDLHLGELAGITWVDEFLADPVLSRYVTRLMAEEVAPLLPAPDGIDLAEYQRSLLRRFADPAIGDRLDRLCRRGSSKIPLYVLPALRAALAQGRPTRLLTLAVAGWCRYLQGTDLAGRPLVLADDRAEELGALALAGGTDPRPLLADDAVFGDLGQDPVFVAALTTALRQLEELGVPATAAWALAEGAATAVPAPPRPALTPQSGRLLPA